MSTTTPLLISVATGVNTIFIVCSIIFLIAIVLMIIKKIV